MTDQALADLIRRLPDRDAFTAIYEDLKQPVYAVCFRILGSREAAEDVCHDVFVKLYTAPPGPDVQKVRAWIFRVARNQAIDALRASSHSISAYPDQLEQTFTPDWDANIDLETALGKLLPEEREVIALHLNGGLGFAQIGRVIGISLPAAYRRYRGALKKLKQYLDGGTL